MRNKNSSLSLLRPGDGMDSFWVMVVLGRPRYWKISSSGIVKQDDGPSPGEGPVLSFDATSDYRVQIGKGGAKAASNAFLQEYLTKTRVFSINKKVWYGTPVERLDDFDHPIYSGTFFLDRLLDNVDRPTESTVVGFRFQTGGEDDFTIVVMYALLSSGELTGLQLALNPPDLYLTLREFADQHKIVGTEPLLFGISDVLGLTVGLSYPVGAMLFGIPKKSAQNAMALAISTVALASYAISGYQYVRAQEMTKSTLEITQQVANSRISIDKILIEHITRYAAMNSINVSRSLGYAEELWAPNVAIESLNADRDNGKIVARIAIQHSVTGIAGAKGPIGMGLESFEDITNNVERKFDNGLTRGKTSLKQESHTYEVEYSFQAMDSAIPTIAGIK
jgi:hypothetical protein